MCELLEQNVCMKDSGFYCMECGCAIEGGWGTNYCGECGAGLIWGDIEEDEE